ncbi:MAG: helix-turn-helix transcriptional regulator, partial [Propionicimonas sp.]
TGQETNIAAAVAQGRSTREVAELLVLSPRTVETHLSSVYRKLGLTGRSGLAQALEPRHD